MSESFSASGFFVQTPCGPRKSGMPESVEMPAPVNTTTRRARSIQSRTVSTPALAIRMYRFPSFVSRYSFLVARCSEGDFFRSLEGQAPARFHGRRDVQRQLLRDEAYLRDV